MGVPVYLGDFYSDDFILNPTQGYADLRAAGYLNCAILAYFMMKGNFGCFTAAAANVGTDWPK